MRKVLTRAESQAITRVALLEAGASLLLENGYHSTSLAAIANSAGRTIGAVYSNYANKEELCLDVLKRRTSDEITAVMGSLAEADDDLDARLGVVARRWATVSADSRLLLLAAEYGLTALREPEQRAASIDATERAIGAVRILIEDHLPESAQSAASEILDRAVHAVVAMGVGLGALQSTDQIGAAEGAALLVETMHMWIDRAINETTLMSN